MICQIIAYIFMYFCIHPLISLSSFHTYIVIQQLPCFPSFSPSLNSRGILVDHLTLEGVCHYQPPLCTDSSSVHPFSSILSSTSHFLTIPSTALSTTFLFISPLRNIHIYFKTHHAYPNAVPFIHWPVYCWGSHK